MQDFINVPKCENWSIRKKPVIHIIRFTRFLKGFSSPHDYHFLYISVLDTDPDSEPRNRIKERIRPLIGNSKKTLYFEKFKFSQVFYDFSLEPENLK